MVLRRLDHAAGLELTSKYAPVYGQADGACGRTVKGFEIRREA
jgi:hypothetical protein